MLFILLRVAIPVALIAGVLWWLVSFLIQEADRRALEKRMDLYEAWAKTIPTMTPSERTLAHLHVLRILKEGPSGGYRGPWEHVPKA